MPSSSIYHKANEDLTSDDDNEELTSSSSADSINEISDEDDVMLDLEEIMPQLIDHECLFFITKHNLHWKNDIVNLKCGLYHLKDWCVK